MTAFAATLVLALLGPLRMGAAADAVVLQLHAPAQFEFAGYYAAQWLGYYRDAGLTVEIRPGGARAQVPIDPVREIAEGRAQFGTGTMQLVVRSAQGLPLLLVAPIFQQSGASIYYRADSDFSSPAALLKGRVGRAPASDILDIEFVTALRAEGIDPASLKATGVTPDQVVAQLANRTIDAVAGSAWTVPWQAHERGIVLKSFNPAHYRVEYYGDSLFTLQRFAATEPETVRRFRAASLKGWEYALQHSDEIAARLVAERPGEPPAADAAGLAHYQADVAKRLSRYPEVPLGHSNLDRWTQIEAGMLGAGALTRSVDLTSFVYNPTGAATPARAGGPWPIVAGLALAALAGLGWFAARFRRRSRTAARPRPGRSEPTHGPARVVRLPQGRSVTRALPPASLNAALAPLQPAIRQRAGSKVECRFSLLPDLWVCRAEGGAVVPIVLDLVGAATAAMGTEGNLIVGTRNFAFDAAMLDDYPDARIGEFARVTVRDNGPGLTDVEFEQILDPDVSARPALAKAAAAAARLGGFARVESAAGIGTAVHLYFARAASAGTVEDEESLNATADVAE